MEHTAKVEGPKHENWPVCDPRAARLENMASEVVKMGTWHAQMGRSMAHIAHQPGPVVCMEGGVSRWLVGVVGLGGGAAPAPTGGAWGDSSKRVAKKNARCPGPPRLARKAWPGWLSYACSREGQGEQSRCFSQPTYRLSDVQEETHSCARDQVVIARPPVLTSH
jgi:hypothetical protein